MGVIMKSKLIVNIKKLISILICVTIISSTLPANLLNYVVFADNELIYVSDFYELQNAVDYANNDDTIILTCDIEVPYSFTETSTKHYCVLQCSKNITIKSLPGQIYTINHRNKDGLLSIINGCTVNLENIICDFGRTNDNSNFDVSNTLIRLYEHSTLNMQSTTIRNAYVQSGSPIYSYQGTINMDENSHITNLHTTDYMGTIYLEDSIMHIDGTIQNCSSKDGGAIYANKAEVTLNNNGSILNCHAARTGGAIAASEAKLTLRGTISGCSAQSAGGIAASKSTLLANGLQISRCGSIWYGGAMYLEESSSLTCVNSNITGCSAQMSGGAIFITTADAYIKDGSTISDCHSNFIRSNFAPQNGGAIVSENGKVVLADFTITNCSAKGLGGVLLLMVLTDNRQPR